MISGFSNVGKELTSLLSKNSTDLFIDKIIIIDKYQKEVSSVVNELRRIREVSSILQNSNLEIVYRQVNYRDISNLEKALVKTRPDIIVITNDSDRTEFFDKTPYRGAFTPFVIPNVYNLLKAKSNTELKSKVINTVFPSWVNHLLVNEGFDVECGVGEVDLRIPQIRRTVAQLLEIDQNMFRINCIGSLNFRNESFVKELNENNFKLSVTVRERDKPYKISLVKDDFYKLFKENCRTTFRISDKLHPFIYDEMCAASCFKVIKLLLRGNQVNFEESMSCLPGVLGQLGNSNCRIDPLGKVQVCKEFSENDAEFTNKNGIYNEGILEIKGTQINFRSDLIDFMKDKYSLDYPKFLDIKDCEEFISGSQFEKFKYKQLLDLT